MTAVVWLVPFQFMTSGTTAQRCKAPACYLSERHGFTTAVSDKFLSEEKTGRILVPMVDPDVIILSWADSDRFGSDWGEILDRARRAGQKVLMDLDDHPGATRGFTNPGLQRTFRHCDGFLFSTPTLRTILGPKLPDKPKFVCPTAFDPLPYRFGGKRVADCVRGDEPWDKPVLAYRGGIQWHSRDVALLRYLRGMDVRWLHFGYDPYRWECLGCGAQTSVAPNVFTVDGKTYTTDRCPSCKGMLGEARPLFEKVAGLWGQPVRRFRILSFRNYARLLAAVAPAIDLGVLPLDATTFTSCKTAIGAMEWSAVGVPWLGSDHPEYRRAAGRMAPYAIVEKPRDWVRKVTFLLEYPKTAAELAGVQRETVESLWNIEKVSAEWAEVLQGVADA